MNPSLHVADTHLRPKHRKNRLHSLRVKLILLSAFLVVACGIAFALLTFSEVRRSIEVLAGRHLAETAREVADVLTSEIRGERENTRNWAANELMREVVIGDLDKHISRFLSSIEARGAPYVALVAASSDGRVVAASAPELVGERGASQPWFDAIRQTDEAVLGPTTWNNSEKPVLQFVAAIRDPEHVETRIGVLLLVYDWDRSRVVSDRVRQNLADVGVPFVDVLILNESGTVVGAAVRDASSGLIATNLHAAHWHSAALAATGRKGFVVDPVPGALVGYAPFDAIRPGWSVLVLQPLSDALARVHRMQVRWALALGAVLVVGLVLTVLLAGRIIRPLRVLMKAIADLARVGQPRHPVHIESRDEVGELAGAFNALVADLTRAEEDLVNAARFAFLGEVAAGIAHEVRTPLGALRTAAQVLGRTPLIGDTQRAELVAMMVSEVDRIDRVVDGLLELARSRQLTIEPVSLSEVLSRAVAFVEAQARAHQVAVHILPPMAPGRPRAIASKCIRWRST